MKKSQIFIAIAAFFVLISVFTDFIPVNLAQLIALLYLLSCGAIIARTMVGLSDLAGLLLAPLVVTIPIGIVGSILYLLWGLSPFVLATLVLLPALSAFLSSHSPAASLSIVSDTSIRRFNPGVIITLYGIAIGVAVTLLFSTQTTESLLGPWDGMPPLFFIAFFIASLMLAALLWIGIPHLLAIVLLTTHFLTSIAIAIIRFPLGFGFDPMLHHAAEQLVLDQGAVTPKTLYYLAQYAVVPFFARVFDLSIASIHQPLTMIIIGLSIPPLLVLTLKRYVYNPLVIALCFLAIPFPHLVMTTPWGLAYGTTFLTLLSSALAAQTGDRTHWIFAGALALFALMLHPLAGIPLLFFLALLASSLARRHIMTAATFVLGALSVPLAFVANAALSQQFHLSFRIPSFNDSVQLIAVDGGFQTRFSPLLDAVYFVSFNSTIILLILAAVGIILTSKMVEVGPRPLVRACLLSAFFITLSGILTSTLLRIDSLAGFEQQDYTKRLFEIAALFLLPFAALCLDALVTRIRSSAAMIRIAALLGLAGLLTAALYLSYPRNDAYTPSHAYTLSETDIHAVRFVDEHARGDSIVVLANQVVASAAIREFGFKKYFNVDGTPVFYYPIPSGSPLVPLYLEMLRSPSHETAHRALNRAGSDRLYFIVRDYELRYPIIVRDAKTTADEWWKIDEGKAYVFLYKQ